LYQWEHNELIKIKLRKRILLCSLKSHIILSLELPQDIEQILQLDMGINKSVGYKNLYALFNQDKKKNYYSLPLDFECRSCKIHGENVHIMLQYKNEGKITHTQEQKHIIW